MYAETLRQKEAVMAKAQAWAQAVRDDPDRVAAGRREAAGQDKVAP
jgi:hypothetical protein